MVELDGGTLVLGGEESLSVVLRLVPWRARSVPGCVGGVVSGLSGVSPGALVDSD